MKAAGLTQTHGVPKAENAHGPALAYGQSYKLQVSNDASTWSDVYSTTTGAGGVEEITLSSPASGRYVRMLGIQRGTIYGYSLWEFEVYNDASESETLTSLASNKSVTASTSYSGCPAANVTDVNPASRWSSEFSDNEGKNGVTS